MNVFNSLKIAVRMPLRMIQVRGELSAVLLQGLLNQIQ